MGMNKSPLPYIAMKKKENNIYNELQMELSNHYSRTRNDMPNTIKAAEYKSCTRSVAGIAGNRDGGGGLLFLPPSIVATARSIPDEGYGCCCPTFEQSNGAKGAHPYLW